MTEIDSASHPDTQTTTNNENSPVNTAPDSISHSVTTHSESPVTESADLKEGSSENEATIVSLTDEGGVHATDKQSKGKSSESRLNNDRLSWQAEVAQNVVSETDEDFESAEEDSSDDDDNKPTQPGHSLEKDTNSPDELPDTSMSTRCSADEIGDGGSSLSSVCERLNESDDTISGESEMSTSSSISSPTEPYKPEHDKKVGGNGVVDHEGLDSSDSQDTDDRARKTASFPPLPASRFSVEGLSLPSESRMERLNEDSSKKSSKGFSKHFSFPANPFSRYASPFSSGSTSPQRPSQVYRARVSRLSSDKQRARESITSIVSLKEMLAQTGKTTEEQQLMVLEELEKLKHEIDVEQDDEPNWDFWALVLVDYDKIAKSNPKQLSQHIKFGVPLSLRGMMWQLFSGSKDEKLEEQYKDLLSDTSTHEKLILRDLARTFPGHDYFKKRGGVGQEGLFNVVKAYSLYDPEVGYCQGLAFVVGPLLLNMPDEEAFCVLVQLMSKYGLRGHFTPQMEQLHRRLYQFEQLLLEKLPRIHRYLQEQGIRSTMYASQWFMTLFAYKFPLDLVFRIFDIILAEGIDSIFQFALAVLQSNEKTILSLEFEPLLDFLKNGLFAEYQDDDRRLVQDACSIHINTKKLKQYGRQHDALVAKEQQMIDKEESLRQSNRELKETIQRLEASLKKLQEDHQDVATQVITSKVDLARLDTSNSELRNQNSVLRRQLDSLPFEIEARWKSQFDTLCKENADLVQRNSTLEDSLTTQEGVVIDLKMRYAESENEKEALQCQLNELKKISSA